MSAFMGIIVRSAYWEFSATKKTGHELVLDLLILAGCYAAVSMVAFIVNLFRAPGLLDAECQKKIADLSVKLELPDKAQADYIRGLVSKLSENAKVILRLALFHEEINNKQLSAVLPAWEQTREGCRECLKLDLLKWGNSSGLSDPAGLHDAYWVPDNLREPLKRILYES
jgi:hypothetical protein